MKWKHSAKTLSSVLTALLLTVAATPVLASIEEENRQSQSNANITFNPSTGPTKPVDPDNPGNVIDPEDPGVEGSLVIVHVPSMDFGDGTVSIQKEIYPLDVTDKPNIQIVDLRGTAVGWKLNVKVSAFQDLDLSEPSLKGALIRVNGGDINSEAATDMYPTAHEVELSTDNSEETLLTAPKGKGTGLYVDRLYSSTTGKALVELEVPAGSASVGNHRATISWTLSDAP